MLLIPAIDLKDGHCVRLKQGDMNDSTTFSEDPAAMARRWVDSSAAASAISTPSSAIWTTASATSSLARRR